MTTSDLRVEPSLLSRRAAKAEPRPKDGRRDYFILPKRGRQVFPSSALLGVGYAVDDSWLVEGDKKRAIGRRQHTNRPPVDQTLGRVRHESGQERDGIGGRLAVLEGHEGHLIAGAARAVPGTVFGDECSALIACGKLLAGIERELQRGNVRSEKNVGNRRFRNQVRALRLDARVHIAADVTVRPAVKAAVHDAREIVRRKVVAKPITLVDGNPGLPGDGFKSQSDGIAQTVCEEAGVFAVGIADG